MKTSNFSFYLAFNNDQYTNYLKTIVSKHKLRLIVLFTSNNITHSIAWIWVIDTIDMTSTIPSAPDKLWSPPSLPGYWFVIITIDGHQRRSISVFSSRSRIFFFQIGYKLQFSSVSLFISCQENVTWLGKTDHKYCSLCRYLPTSHKPTQHWVALLVIYLKQF